MINQDSLKVKTKPERKQWFMRFPIQEQILFAKRLSLFSKAGVPIMKALYMLLKQTKHKGTKLILEHLIAGVEQGQSMSATLRLKYRKLVGEFMINIIEIGEVSGTLRENLSYLAEELQKKQALRRKIINALVYPIFIIIATLGITLLLVMYVFPKVMPIFSSFPSFELPISTQILIFISDFFRDYWYVLLISTILLTVGFFLGLRNERFHTFVHRSSLRIPIVGEMLRSYHLANLTRIIAVLLRSNVPIVRTLQITADAATNLEYRNQLRLVAEQVRHGTNLHTALAKFPKLFPPITEQMVEVGETTGSLSSSLMFLAELYENEVEDQTKNLSAFLEPALMVFIGLMVGFVAISIITPIYTFTQSIRP
jgi:type IV pilus assembly protein PilC